MNVIDWFIFGCAFALILGFVGGIRRTRVFDRRMREIDKRKDDL